MTTPKKSAADKTPMQMQWDQAKAAHPDALLLFRMGDFYEMFGDDAKRGSELLGLTLTTRDKNKAEAMPMAGLPVHALDRYLKELIAAGVRVAICEQLENPATATGVIKRGITRVVTPGTVIDDNCLADKKNNFLLAVAECKGEIGLAIADISTGEFFAVESAKASVREDIERFSPSEILSPVELLQAGKTLEFLRGNSPSENVTDANGAIGATLTKRDGYEFSATAGLAKLTAHFGVESLDGFGLNDAPAIIGAAGALLAYLEETQKHALPHLKNLRRLHAPDFMMLDCAAQRNLDLIVGAHPQFTLAAAVDRTLTAAGGRLLKMYLLRPLLDVRKIQTRQEAVAELMREDAARKKIREELRQVADLERLLARLATGRAGPRDLFSLGTSLSRLPKFTEIVAPLSASRFAEMKNGFPQLSALADFLQTALVENPPLLATDGGFIRAEFNEELAQLRDLAAGGKDWIANYERQERERVGIPSLKIGFNRVFGYYLEITNANRAKIPADYLRKQTLSNAERCTTPELKDYENKILGAEEKSRELEQQIFTTLTAEVLKHTREIQRAAECLACLDVWSAFADLGATRHYVLPEIHDGIDTEIIAGRHPVLDAYLPNFTPNQTVFDATAGFLHVITGPNMAGKSTYIRQAALLTILAQCGAPLPCERARIGLVDRVFTRVGAADDLSRGQSTFMVEMAETANILRNATSRSLIVLDEVGRGTSTFDGVSLAWAITEYLHDVVKARALFATHYHELAELGDLLAHARNYHAAVKEWDEKVVFLHQIIPGAADRSYGIQVARLAGVPTEILMRAKIILQKLETAAEARDRDEQKEKKSQTKRSREIGLFAPPDYRDFVEQLAAIDINNLSPLAAQQTLATMIERAKSSLL